MAQSPPGTGELARRIVMYEAGGSSGASATAAAAEAACERLNTELRTFLGSGGSTALLRRALSLAKRDHPILASVSWDQARPTGLVGLPDAIAGGADDDAMAASAAIIEHLLALLVLLLGQELGTRPVRKLWPQLTSDVREIDQ